jgi:hypothetical protein
MVIRVDPAAILEMGEVREKRMGGGLCQDWQTWLGRPIRSTDSRAICTLKALPERNFA